MKFFYYTSFFIVFIILLLLSQLCHGGSLQSGLAAASVRGRNTPLSEALSQQEQAAAWDSFLNHKLGIVALSMQTPA
jgi:hypothetical protein